MRQMNRLISLIGSLALTAGCAISDDLLTSKAPSEPLALTAGVRVSTEGILSYGGFVVFGENPTTLLEANDFHGYEFDGKAGGNIVGLRMHHRQSDFFDADFDIDVNDARHLTHIAAALRANPSVEEVDRTKG